MKFIFFILFFFTHVTWATDAFPDQSPSSNYFVDENGNRFTSSSSGTIRALDVRDQWLKDAVNFGASSTILAIQNNAASTTTIVTSATTTLNNTLILNRNQQSANASATITAINNNAVSNATIITSATTTLNNTITSGTASIITANNNITTSSTVSLINATTSQTTSLNSQSVSSTAYLGALIDKANYDSAVVSDRNDGGAIAAGGSINVNYAAVPAGQVMEVKELWGHSTAAWRIEVYVDGVLKFDNTNVANVTYPYVCPPFRLTAGQVLQLRKYNRNGIGAASVYSILWYAMRTL